MYSSRYVYLFAKGTIKFAITSYCRRHNNHNLVCIEHYIYPFIIINRQLRVIINQHSNNLRDCNIIKLAGNSETLKHTHRYCKGVNYNYIHQLV